MEMLSLVKVAKIRHRRLVEGQSIRSIAQDLGVSRNTVRKVLRSGSREHVYERCSSVQPRPKLGDHVGELETLLEVNGKGRRRDQLNTKQIWQHLCDLGCEASYEAVRRHVRDWEHRHGCGLVGAHVPLSFEPGEAYQFDWSHEQVLIGGMPVTVKVAQFILCYSRMPFIRCYPRESQEMVFDAHDRAFAAFDGQCERGIYDNMSTAVKSVLRNRNLGEPLLVVSDGAAGIIKAIEIRFPRSERQRCLAHRMRNLACKVPESQWPDFKDLA